jgi:DNA polymerase-3 subunit delta
MAEVEYGSLKDLVQKMKAGETSPVYLLYGEEFLCKNAFERLVDVLVPDKETSLNYESLDGATVSAEEIIGRLNTFPLFSGAKVVAVHGTRAFYSKASVEELAKRSIGAFDKQDLEAAARHFVNMLSLAGLSLDDMRQGGLERLFKNKSTDGLQVDPEKLAAWKNQMSDFCHQHHIGVPGSSRADEVLNEAITSGIPKGNNLVLVCDVVDKRKRLYKTIKQIGVIIDCSVPQGSSRGDERERMTLLRAHAKKVLAAAGKRAAPQVIEALYEKTGANFRSFDSEMHKLVAFVGDRGQIELDDIASALEKTKQDPIYELGNAVGERDVVTALYYVQSLLAWDFHPLQILSAVANQIRKLVLGKELIDRLLEGRWDERLDYRGFQKSVWPKAKAMDDGAHVKGMHPYVVYKTLVFASNYDYEQLASAFEALMRADQALKTGGKNGKFVLERAIIETCTSVSKESSRVS